MATFSRIITHVWPHLDEIVAIRLLKKHGEQKFPGISQAKVVFSGTGVNPEDKTWQQHMDEGTLVIGIGGGPFDEHPTMEEERKHGKSACQLVAEALNLQAHPIYRRLIELVTEADQMGVHEFHIANRLKTNYRLNPDHPEIGIKMVNDILDDWEHEQQLFVDGRVEIQKLMKTDAYKTATLPDGRKLGIIVVQNTNNYKMSAAARSLRIPIIIQQQPKGNVQIFCDSERNNFSMKKVAAKIRIAECLASGMSEADVAKLDATALEREGKIPEVTNWFYQVPGQNMINGSETTPQIPGTKIPMNILVEIVQKNLISLS
jgi:hypothetical protein